MRPTLLAAAAGLFWGTAPWTCAAEIFTNFGPGDSYQTGRGHTIGQVRNPPLFQEEADALDISGGSYLLHTIQLAASWVSGPNEYIVWLAADANNQPGEVLEEFRFSNLGRFGVDNPPLIARSVQHPLLEEGQRYWIVHSTTESSTMVANWNSTGDGVVAIRTNGGAWFTITDFPNAFRVTGRLLGEGTTALGRDGSFGQDPNDWMREETWPIADELLH